MSFAVLRSIPMPHPDHMGRGHPTKYPWATMEVGDMFFVPFGNERMEVTERMAGIVGARNKRGNEKYSRRVTIQDGVEGLGVWRIR